METGAKHDTFIVSFPSYFVLISQEPNDDTVDVVIRLINKDGDVADAFSDVDLKGTIGLTGAEQLVQSNGSTSWSCAAYCVGIGQGQ